MDEEKSKQVSYNPCTMDAIKKLETSQLALWTVMRNRALTRYCSQC